MPELSQTEHRSMPSPEYHIEPSRIEPRSETCVKFATFSATFLATSSKSLENQDIGQTDHIEHKYDLHFDLRLDLQGQIRGQRTGNGLEVKVTNRFCDPLAPKDSLPIMASRSQKTRFVNVILQGQI